MTDTARAASASSTALQARLAEIRTACWRALDQVRAEPFEQDWTRLSDDLGALFGEAIELRHRLEGERARSSGGPPAPFLQRFEALERWQLDFSQVDPELLVRCRRLLVHEVRNDVAVLHLVVDAAELQPEPSAGPLATEEALARIRALLEIALD